MDITFTTKVPSLEPEVFVLFLETLFKPIHPLVCKVKEMKGIFNDIFTAVYIYIYMLMLNPALHHKEGHA